MPADIHHRIEPPAVNIPTGSAEPPADPLFDSERSRLENLQRIKGGVQEADQ